MRKRFICTILTILLTTSLCFAGSVTKGLVGKQDTSPWDGVTSTFTRATSAGYTVTLNKIDWPGVDVLSVYGGGVNRTDDTITTALTAIGTSNKVSVWLSPGSWVFDENVDWSSYTNVTFNIPPGALIAHGAYTLNLPNPNAGEYQIFDGSGAVTISGNVPEITVEWMGDIDGTADDVQINAAITAATNNQVIKAFAATYTCAASIALNKSCTLSLGTTTITSTADPVVQITADDVVIEGINRKQSKLINTAEDEHIIRSSGAARKGITIRNLYLSGGSKTGFAPEDRAKGDLIWIGDETGHHTDITIENCYFTDGYVAILFSFVDDSKIINNTFDWDTASFATIDLWSSDRVKIEGNTFLDSGGAANAIEILHAQDDPSLGCIINGNTFHGVWDYEVINLLGAKHSVTNNYIYSNGSAVQAIQVSSPTTDTVLTCYDNNISHNYIHIDNAAGLAAITLKDGSDSLGVKRCIVSNNIILFDGISAAIQVGPSGDGYAIDNKVEGNIILCTGAGVTQGGIYIGGSSSTGNAIRNNWISGSGTYGIYSNEAESCTIEQNDVTASVSHGIYVSGGNNHIVNNNRSYSNGGWGITLYSATSETVKRFSGNLAYSNTAGQLDPAGMVIDSEVLTGTVTIDRDFKSATIDSSGGAVTGTLGSGVYIGQIKTIVMSDSTTSSTVSVSLHVESDPEVFTFDAVDETLVVMWTGTEWATIYATATS